VSAQHYWQLLGNGARRRLVNPVSIAVNL